MLLSSPHFVVLHAPAIFGCESIKDTWCLLTSHEIGLMGLVGCRHLFLHFIFRWLIFIKKKIKEKRKLIRIPYKVIPHHLLHNDKVQLKASILYN